MKFGIFLELHKLMENPPVRGPGRVALQLSFAHTEILKVT